MSSEYKNKFQEIRSLGNGGFSTVFEVISIKDGKSYAIKKIPFKEQDLNKTMNEIIIFSELESDYVVRYFHSWVESNHCISDVNDDNNNLFKPEKPLLLHIQIELCSMTLDAFIKSISYSTKNSMNPKHYCISCELFIQLLECINYLHSRNPPIIHRDLKPQNILLTNGDNNRCVKLTDFGLSTFHEFTDQSHTSRIGTDGYRAPEVITSKQYTTKADIYSLGRIMEQLFNIDVNGESFENVNEINKKYENLKAICISCLSAITNKRPNCDEILKNRYEWEFNRYYTNELYLKIRELLYETVFKFNLEKWPLIMNIKLDFLKTCKYMSVIEEIEEIAIFVTNDDRVYAVKDSDLNNNTIEKQNIINELTNKGIQTIVCGYCHTLCLTKYNQIYSFGDNSCGQLGDGTYKSNNTPCRISELYIKHVIYVKCGAYHSLALTKYGKIFVWGNGWCGQIGNGFDYDTCTPIEINFPKSEIIRSISCGFNHSLALTVTEILYGWGENIHGQLGIGNYKNQNSPLMIIFDEKITIKKISCGRLHSLVLTTDNEIYSFGCNNFGQLGIGNDYWNVNQNKPIKIKTTIKFIDIEANNLNDFSVGLSLDNEYYIWGECCNKSITSPKKTNFKSFNEAFFQCTRKYIFNDLMNYQNSQIFLNHVRIKESKAILVSNDDIVYSFRLNESIESPSEEPIIINELSNRKIIRIICGYNHVLCLTENNEIISFGDNSYGQLGNGTHINNYKPTIIEELNDKNIVEISCGGYHCLALSECGKLFVWGNGFDGQIGNNDNNIKESPVNIKLIESVKMISISCGAHHCLALSSLNELYGWGWNEFGQLGNGSNINQYQPIRIETPEDIIISKISCGPSHSLLLTNHNDIYSFGRNNCGQLGIGNQYNQNRMIKINTTVKFIDIYSTHSDYFSAGLSQNGKYLIWGKCGNEVITTPKHTDFESFDELFAKYSFDRITCNNIILNKNK